jgi:hypothetical protein
MKRLILVTLVIFALIVSILTPCGKPVQAAGESSTYYAVFHPTVVGTTTEMQTAENWATLREGSGTAAYGNLNVYMSTAQYVENKWRWLMRGGLIFDTSPLPDNAVKTGATLSTYVNSKIMEASRPDFTVGLYEFNPTSDNAIVAADFGNYGSTQYTGSTVDYGDFTTSAYNTFILNAAGLSAVSLDGVTTIGLREAYYDVAGNEPPFVSYAKDTGIVMSVNTAITGLWTADSSYTEARDELLYDGYLYIAMSNGLAKVDPTTMTTVAINPTPILSRNLMEWDGYIYYAANLSPAVVYKINPDTMGVVGTWTGDTGQNDACGLAHDDDYLYVTTGASGISGKVIRVDRTTMTTSGSIWVDSASEGAFGLSRLGDYLYVGIRTANPSRVVKIQKSDLTTTANWTGASGVTDARDVINDGTYVYVSHNIDGSAGKVSKISTNMTTEDTWTGTGTGQSHIKKLYHDGTYLWVSCDRDPAVVLKVDPSIMDTIGTWTGTTDQKYAYMVQKDGDNVYVCLNKAPAPILSQAIVLSETTMSVTTVQALPVLIVQYEIPEEESAVTTLDATNVEETTATLSGNITSASGLDSRGFVWDTSTHNDPGNTAPGDSDYSNNWTESSSSMGVYTTNIADLIEGTLYYVRAVLHDSGGWTYGDEITFLTASTEMGGKYLVIYIDGIEKGAVPLGDNTVPDNDNGWVIGSNATTYLGRFLIKVDGDDKCDLQWEYDTIFHDASGKGNDGYPSFPTESTPDVTGTMTNFGTTNAPGAVTEENSEGFRLLETTDIITPPGLENDVPETPTFLGAGILITIANGTETPLYILVYLYAFGLAILLGFAAYALANGRISKNNPGANTRGSVLAQAVVSLGVLTYFVYAGGGVISWLVLIPVGIEALVVIIWNIQFNPFG